MTHDPNRPTYDPTPVQLAAYLDGKLTGREREAVATWLTANPEAGALAAGFFDRDDDLTNAWQATQPAQPTPGAWSIVRSRIESALPSSFDQPLRPRRRGRLFLAVGAVAATVAIVILGRSLVPQRAKPVIGEPNPVAVLPEEREDPREPEESEPELKDKKIFKVAAPAEVSIICMNGDDTHVLIGGRVVKTLVVGEPPVPDNLILPTSYERTRMIASVDPELRFVDWSSPIIVDPAVLENGWRP